MRKPLQGVWNIIRFNWHFFLLAVLLRFSLDFILFSASDSIRVLIVGIDIILFFVVFIPLLVSWHVYDMSGLYDLAWLEDIDVKETGTILNIHAGFDEMSELLANHFPQAQLTVYDFYDPEKHTELSIRRARKAYQPYPGTIQISTSPIPPANQSVDMIFLMLAAHEIRDDDERAVFFSELRRTLKPDGMIMVTEHLRDAPNFIAYNVGAFHFLSRDTWAQTFRSSGLIIARQLELNSFITTYILRHDRAAA